MRKRFLFVWSGFALLLSLEISGCSLIGYGIGSAIDAGRVGRTRPGDRSLILKLEPGSKLMIRRADGSTVAGTYHGLLETPDSDYAKGYAAWRDTATLAFRPPQIGEPIRIVRKESNSMAGKTVRATFLGFGPKRVHYRPRGKKTYSLPFARIGRIVDSSGNSISRTDLEQASERLPVQMIAMVQSRNGGERQLDLLDDRIVEFRFAVKRHTFRTTGLVVGALADATLILAVAALSSYSNSSSSCQPTYTGGSYYMDAGPTLLESIPDSMYVLPGRGAIPTEPMAVRSTR
jgi:hypothetical protein